MTSTPSSEGLLNQKPSVTAGSAPPSSGETCNGNAPKCGASTQTPKSLGTSGEDSTGSARDSSPYWSEFTGGISSLLWLPTGTGSPGSDLNSSRGGYAVNTAFSDASRIANALGYQFISLVPRQEINAFANLAKIAGEPDDEVESFRNADLVLLVQDSLGQPRYLVVEVSYRISGDDIRRARRNAEYLERFITMTSVGAVAGVRLTDNMKREAEANHVEWHQIRPT